MPVMWPPSRCDSSLGRVLFNGGRVRRTQAHSDRAYPSSGERMVIGSRAIATPTPVLSDAVLVERIAALGDRAALAELDARYGMTLYAIAYTLLLNPDAADVTAAATLREAGGGAASFNGGEQPAGGCLAGLARRAAQDQLRRRAMSSAYA